MQSIVDTLGKSGLLIWGASGQALVVSDIVRLNGNYAIVGYIDDVNVERHGSVFGAAKILGGQEQLVPMRQAGVGCLIVAIGNCTARLELGALARAKGFDLPSLIHPHSIIAQDVLIGAGTVICAGAVINSGARIGESVIINTSASVDHECYIDNGVHISPGAHLGGGVTVGRSTWIGIGATVIDHVRIGSHTVIGAGAVVVNDIPDGVVAFGVPAKPIRRSDAIV
jgi:acetyltransferase EpsM